MDEEARTELNIIIEGLTPRDRAFIATLAENEVIRLHFGLGTWIRNQMRHGKMKALLRWSRTQVPERPHFDDLSWPILVEVWKTLRSSSGC